MKILMKFLNFLFLILFFENLLLKIEPSEITPFFYNNLFRFRGGGIPPFPPGYALVWEKTGDDCTLRCSIVVLALWSENCECAGKAKRSKVMNFTNPRNRMKMVFLISLSPPGPANRQTHSKQLKAFRQLMELN